MGIEKVHRNSAIIASGGRGIDKRFFMKNSKEEAWKWKKEKKNF